MNGCLRRCCIYVCLQVTVTVILTFHCAAMRLPPPRCACALASREPWQSDNEMLNILRWKCNHSRHVTPTPPCLLISCSTWAPGAVGYGLLHFQAGGRTRRSKLALVFLCLFCVITPTVFCVPDECLLLLC